MHRFLFAFVFIVVLPFAAKAQGKFDQHHDTLPKPIAVSSKQNAIIAGKRFDYEATAGRMELIDVDGKPMALFGYTSYMKVEPAVKTAGNTPNTRPIVFAFNGGPGSSSIWLHMGALGPKRVVVNDPHPSPNAPYTLEDNDRSLLNVADLVMLDPIGTGISVPMGKYEYKDFWGVDEDARSIAAFIRQFLIVNGRMNSPRYLLGESYGTFRNAAVMSLMQDQGLPLNGVIMVSAVFDLLPLTFPNDNDLAFIVHLPTYASTAWYHNKLETKPDDLEAFLDEVRRFTEMEYAPALFRGDRLESEAQNRLAAKLQAYTGIEASYWLRARLRLKADEFFAELLRDEGAVVGRLDARYRGPNQDMLSQSADYDPFISSLSPPYTSLFFDYYYRELGVPYHIQYKTNAYSQKGFKWNWEHKGNTSWNTTTAITTAPDMARTLTLNPYTKVLIMNGYFDLGTPFYAVEYTIDRLGLIPELRSNITMTYYKAGHMMYTDEESFDAFARDIREFILDAAGGSKP